MENADLIVQSKRDLLEDVRIADFLAEDCRKKLHGSSYEYLWKPIFDQNIFFKKIVLEIVDEKSLICAIEHKRALYNFFRELFGIAGSILVSTHWQSPEIGSYKGKIKPAINDYTRDQHIVGNAFEDKFRKELVPIKSTIPVFSYATSSGMAAMTTALLYILGETKNDSPILLGTSCYFETKQLVYKMFGSRVKEIDVSNTNEVSLSIHTYSPSAILVDSLGNEPKMTRVDAESLVRVLSHETKHHIHLVVDTSSRATNELLLTSFTMPHKVSLIGVTSLNKLFQFGMDRVTAGMVWGTGFKAMKLYDYRDRAGTNCPDSTIASLPTPNKKMLDLYIKRIVRNNMLIGKSLHVDSKNGPYIIVSENTSLRQIRNYVSRILKNAHQKNIPLIHGTSFGLHTTRVYIVAMHTQYEKPFLRISTGTETLWEIARLKKIFAYS